MRLLGFLVLITSVAMFSSCKKDDTVANDGKVVLYSFGPTGAKPGDTLRFIGVNLDKVSSINFTGTNATVDQKNFIQQKSDLILLIVPQGTEKGLVTLKTSDGDLVTKTQLNLKVAAVETSMTPQARPGENVTINGNYLNWVTSVTFENGKVVTNFVSKSLNQLVVTVPADAQTGPLIMRYMGTDSANVQTKDTLKVTLPVATSFAPNPVKHQTEVTINGTDLDLTKQVIFSGVSTPITSFVSQSATQLKVIVPSSTTSGKVTLVPLSGVKSVSAADLNVLLPSVTSIAPNPINPGGNLTVTGTNLDLVSSVSFIGASSPVTSFVSQSATQIVVKLPTGVLKGKVTLGVKNSTLTVQSSTDLVLTGGLPPLADFTFPIYTDAPQQGFQDWSYTDIHDFNNTENVRQGTKAIKAVYGGNGYQGITFHNGSSLSVAGYTKLELSIFASAADNGKKLQVVTNGAYGGSVPQITLVGGEWTTYSVTLASMGNPTSISEIVLQGAGFSGTVYIDHVGLR